MQLRITAASTLAPDQLYAWWTDYQPGKDDHPVGSQWWIGGRVIHERAPGVIEMVDDMHVLGLIPWKERVVARLEPARLRVHVEGENAFATFTGEYRFQQAANRSGTDASFMGAVRPKGLLQKGERYGRPLIRFIVAKDLEMHLREAERELAADPTPEAH